MKVALIGYGKMGRAIEKILLDRGHTVDLVIDMDNAGDLNADRLRDIDVAIEFSTPSTAYENVVKCLEAATPVVCGTTAWLDKLPAARELCERRGGALFYASNYSIGVNIFFKINRQLARMMNPFAEFDVTIEETHHTQKKDAPSGTAITMAEGVLEELERKNKWVCATTTEPNELEITAIRRSVVPGMHTVTYESPEESISMTHTIKDRNVLARGAVQAAEFLCGKKGVYGMDDLIVL